MKFEKFVAVVGTGKSKQQIGQFDFVADVAHLPSSILPLHISYLRKRDIESTLSTPPMICFLALSVCISYLCIGPTSAKNQNKIEIRGRSLHVFL